MMPGQIFLLMALIGKRRKKWGRCAVSRFKPSNHANTPRNTHTS